MAAAAAISKSDSDQQHDPGRGRTTKNHNINDMTKTQHTSMMIDAETSPWNYVPDNDCRAKKETINQNPRARTSANSHHSWFLLCLYRLVNTRGQRLKPGTSQLESRFTTRAERTSEQSCDTSIYNRSPQNEMVHHLKFNGTHEKVLDTQRLTVGY